MSLLKVRDINARLRAAGVTVHEAPGWENRGNGQTAAYEGGLVHHTATAHANAVPTTSSYKLLVDGRPDLRGPLCNHAGNMNGSLTVIAAHPANHAGSSGGKSMGPLPTTTSFNRRVLGLEIVYPGTQPMTPEQYRTALIWAKVVADVVGGGNIERVRAHAETSITGKWDPGEAPGKTINMAAFRAAALHGGVDVTPEEHSMLKFIKDRVAGIMPQKYWVKDPDDPTGMKILEVPPSHPGAQPATLLDTLAGNYIVHQLLPLADDEAKILAAIGVVRSSVEGLKTGSVDVAKLAELLAPALAPLVQLGITEEEAEAAVRRVFASVAQPK